MLVLIGLSAAFAWAVFHNGGSEAPEWRLSALAVAAVSIAYWLRVPRWKQAPPLRPVLRISLFGLLAYSAAQLVPLPPALIAVLAPARAAVAHSYAAAGGAPEQWTPLAVAGSFDQVLRIAVCVLVVLLVREVCWQLEDRAWLSVAPLVMVAALQALIGLAQYYSGEPPARGSYVNRNHFAGLLEMTAPFALLSAAAVMRGRARRNSQARAALFACAALAAALLILVALLDSLSRMGFVAGLVAVLVAAYGLVRAAHTRTVAAGNRRRARAAVWGGAALAAVVLFFFIALPPEELIRRFGDLGAPPVEDRPELWRETLPLIRDYAVFGCGLGGFESAFMRYKASAAMSTDDFAHNDYLQYLAELGLIGFCAAAIAAVAFLIEAIRAAARHATFQGRCLAVACIAAFAAIGLHSIADFNLYIPANSMLLAWIAGVAGGVILSSHPTSSPKVVELVTAD